MDGLGEAVLGELFVRDLKRLLEADGPAHLGAGPRPGLAAGGRILELLAESVGFEPTVRLPAQRFSSSMILMLCRAVAKSVHQFTIFASTILACDALCHAVPRSRCNLVCKRLP